MRNDETQAILHKIEADINAAISKVLDRYCDEDAFWYPTGLSASMARAALHTLEVADDAVRFGKDEL